MMIIEMACRIRALTTLTGDSGRHREFSLVAHCGVLVFRFKSSRKFKTTASFNELNTFSLSTARIIFMDDM
jgi:hypothetical protein